MKTDDSGWPDKLRNDTHRKDPHRVGSEGLPVMPGRARQEAGDHHGKGPMHLKFHPRSPGQSTVSYCVSPNPPEAGSVS